MTGVKRRFEPPVETLGAVLKNADRQDLMRSRTLAGAIGAEWPKEHRTGAGDGTCAGRGEPSPSGGPTLARPAKCLALD